MRTTMTIEIELADRLNQIAAERHQSFKEVVNSTIRLGLARLAPTPPPFDYQAHNGGLLPGIDPRRLNALAAELDDDRFRP